MCVICYRKKKGVCKIKKIKVSYSGKEVVHGVSMDIEPKSIVALIGASGCGKSTSLAAMIETINKTRSVHIITLEDPIEYVINGVNQSQIMDSTTNDAESDTFTYHK